MIQLLFHVYVCHTCFTSIPASAISIRNGTFQYAADAETPTLQDINMEIKHGQLIAIVGTVGTGKTTLLGALMGEVVKKSGNVTVSVWPYFFAYIKLYYSGTQLTKQYAFAGVIYISSLD